MQSDPLESLYSFANYIGSMILPGSVQMSVPSWDSEKPSSDFLRAIVKFEFEIKSFQGFLEEKYGKKFWKIDDAQINDCIIENSAPTREFFRLLGDLYIIEYYSRTKTLLALGLLIDPPFPRGNKVHEGDLEKLELVFNKGRIYK
jgi:hypothetical protein